MTLVMVIFRYEWDKDISQECTFFVAAAGMNGLGS